MWRDAAGGVVLRSRAALCAHRLAKRVAAVSTRRGVSVGHLSRAFAAEHAGGPDPERCGGAVGFLVAYGARIGAAAAREAQPAVRMLVVPARALLRSGLPTISPIALNWSTFFSAA